MFFSWFVSFHATFGDLFVDQTLLEGLTRCVYCGGDYSAALQESFYASSIANLEPRLGEGKASQAQPPPLCNGDGKFIEGTNEIGSCDGDCLEGYEKHFFFSDKDGKDEEFCCCGKCS